MRAAFQEPSIVKSLEEGGYRFVCVHHLLEEPVAGALPGSEYSVELFRYRGAPPKHDAALYGLTFKDMGIPPLGECPEGPSSYMSVLEERPRRSGLYGLWTAPPRPAFWQVQDYYHYSWIEAGLSPEPQPWYAPKVQGFYHYFAALIYFDPIPLSLRPTTVVTELWPYYPYPFRDVLRLSPEVGSYVYSQRGPGGWG